jgi:hypothetical protein
LWSGLQDAHELVMVKFIIAVEVQSVEEHVNLSI